MLDAGPLTAYELATRMWGNVAVTQAYLTISEVLGHMDLLVGRRTGRRGRARDAVTRVRRRRDRTAVGNPTDDAAVCCRYSGASLAGR